MAVTAKGFLRTVEMFLTRHMHGSRQFEKLITLAIENSQREIAIVLVPASQWVSNAIVENFDVLQQVFFGIRTHFSSILLSCRPQINMALFLIEEKFKTINFALFQEWLMGCNNGISSLHTLKHENYQRNVIEKLPPTLVARIKEHTLFSQSAVRSSGALLLLFIRRLNTFNQFIVHPVAWMDFAQRRFERFSILLASNAQARDTAAGLCLVLGIASLGFSQDSAWKEVPSRPVLACGAAIGWGLTLAAHRQDLLALAAAAADAAAPDGGAGIDDDGAVAVAAAATAAAAAAVSILLALAPSALELRECTRRAGLPWRKAGLALGGAALLAAGAALLLDEGGDAPL